MNVQPGIWLPVAVYVEETQRTEAEKSVGLKAQTHFWGYSLKLPTRDSENVSVKVDDAVDKSDDSQDVGPLQASRMWITQAENNVIDRLVEAGLVAPLDAGGYENKVLDQIVINLVVPNNLAFTDQIHCRVLLTDTVEATTVGNTILLSKGLIDSLPSEEAIASVIAMELAHIAMGHHIDTRYAFNDRLLFPDDGHLPEHRHEPLRCGQRIRVEAGDGVSGELHVQGPAGECGPLLRAVGGSGQGAEGAEHADAGRLAAPGRMARRGWRRWSTMAPKLNWDDLAQTPALPLGSWLKTDPWDDKVHMLSAKRYAPMNARDKMPFEVTPIFYKLQRYEEASVEPAPAAPAAPAPGAQPANDQPAAAPDNAQPAPPAQSGSSSAAAPDQQNTAGGAAPAQQPAAAQNPQP